MMNEKIKDVNNLEVGDLYQFLLEVVKLVETCLF